MIRIFFWTLGLVLLAQPQPQTLAAKTEDQPMSAFLKLVVKPEDIILPKVSSTTATTAPTTTSGTTSSSSRSGDDQRQSNSSSLSSANEPDKEAEGKTEMSKIPLTTRPRIMMKPTSTVLNTITSGPWRNLKRRRSTLPPFLSAKHPQLKHRFKPRPDHEATTTPTPTNSTSITTATPPQVYTVLPSDKTKTTTSDQVYLVFPTADEVGHNNEVEHFSNFPADVSFAQLENYKARSQLQTLANATTSTSPTMHDTNYSVLSQYDGYINEDVAVAAETEESRAKHTLAKDLLMKRTTATPFRHFIAAPMPPVTSTQALNELIPDDPVASSAPSHFSEAEFDSSLETLAGSFPAIELQNVDVLVPRSMTFDQADDDDDEIQSTDGGKEGEVIAGNNVADHWGQEKGEARRSNRPRNRKGPQLLANITPIDVGTSIFVMESPDRDSHEENEKLDAIVNAAEVSNWKPKRRATLSPGPDQLEPNQNRHRFKGESQRRHHHHQKHWPGVDQMSAPRDRGQSQSNGKKFRPPPLGQRKRRKYPFKGSRRPGKFDHPHWQDQQGSASNVTRNLVKTPDEEISPLVTVDNEVDGIQHPESAPSYNDVLADLDFGQRLENQTKVGKQETTRIVINVAANDEEKKKTEHPIITTYRPKFEIPTLLRKRTTFVPKRFTSTLTTTTSTTTTLKPRAKTPTTLPSPTPDFQLTNLIYHHPTVLPNLVTERSYTKGPHFQPTRVTSTTLPIIELSKVPDVRSLPDLRVRSQHPLYGEPPRPKRVQPPGLRPHPHSFQPPFPLQGHFASTTSATANPRVDHSYHHSVTSSPLGYKVIAPGAFVEVNLNPPKFPDDFTKPFEAVRQPLEINSKVRAPQSPTTTSLPSTIYSGEDQSPRRVNPTANRLREFAQPNLPLNSREIEQDFDNFLPSSFNNPVFPSFFHLPESIKDFDRNFKEATFDELDTAFSFPPSPYSNNGQVPSQQPQRIFEATLKAEVSVEPGSPQTTVTIEKVEKPDGIRTDIEVYDQLNSPLQRVDEVERNQVKVVSTPTKNPFLNKDQPPRAIGSRPSFPRRPGHFTRSPLRKPFYGKPRPGRPPAPTSPPSLATTITNLLEKISVSSAKSAARNHQERGGPRKRKVPRQLDKPMIPPHVLAQLEKLPIPHQSEPRKSFESVNQIDDKPASKRIPDKSILATLDKHGLTEFSRLLVQAGLDVELEQSGPFTVFAPTNEAVRMFLESQFGEASMGRTKLKQNKKELLTVLRNHVVKGLVPDNKLEDDLVGTNLAGSKLRSNLYISEDQNWREVQIKTVNGAVMTRVDMKATNGVIHEVDRVIFPPTSGNILQMLKNDPEQRFTTFLKAIKAAKLENEISDYSTGPWTCFAPTNEAFMNLPMLELEAIIKDHAKLRKLILNHMINKTLYHAGLKSHEIIRMANGEERNLFSRRDRLKIEGANVINMDIPADNGVIQVIESIVDLPEFELLDEV